MSLAYVLRKRMAALLVLPLGALSAGCTSPSVTGEVLNEPVCLDFTLGAVATPMKGALQKPVKATILEDDEAVWSRILLGRRSATDPPSKFVIPDSDEEYKVRWSQCENVFAPKRANAVVDPNAKRGGGYACGEAKEYTKTDLKIVGGDPASRVIEWQAPPEPQCWATIAVEPSATASADAGAGGAAPDAGAGGTKNEGGGDAGGGGAATTATSSATATAKAEDPPKPKPPAPKPPAPKPPAPKPPAPEPPAPAPAPPPPPPTDAAPKAP